LEVDSIFLRAAVDGAGIKKELCKKDHVYACGRGGSNVLHEWTNVEPKDKVESDIDRSSGRIGAKTLERKDERLGQINMSLNQLKEIAIS
jgi:hypothetical protein